MSFDNICKRLAEFYPRDFASWLLGQPVDEVEVLKTELGKEPIRADSLIMLRLSGSILHMEFQTTPRSKPPLPLRMLDYWVQGYRKYELPIEQFVIVLTETGEEIPTEFRAPNTWHRYHVIKVWEIDPALLLGHPGLLPLALLARSPQPEALLRQVAEKVTRLEPEELRPELTSCAFFLAGLRFDKELVRSLFPEAIMQESSTYQDLVQRSEQKGFQQGLGQGIEQGIEQGILKGGASITLLQLQNLLGVLNPTVQSHILALPLEQIQELGVALLDFAALSDLEAWLAQHPLPSAPSGASETVDGIALQP